MSKIADPFADAVRQLEPQIDTDAAWDAFVGRVQRGRVRRRWLPGIAALAAAALVLSVLTTMDPSDPNGNTVTSGVEGTRAGDHATAFGFVPIRFTDDSLSLPVEFLDGSSLVLRMDPDLDLSGDSVMTSVAARCVPQAACGYTELVARRTTIDQAFGSSSPIQVLRHAGQDVRVYERNTGIDVLVWEYGPWLLEAHTQAIPDDQLPVWVDSINGTVSDDGWLTLAIDSPIEFYGTTDAAAVAPQAVFPTGQSTLTSLTLSACSGVDGTDVESLGPLRSTTSRCLDSSVRANVQGPDADEVTSIAAGIAVSDLTIHD